MAIYEVGRTGFEPATPWSQTRYSTGLNYLPNYSAENESFTRSNFLRTPVSGGYLHGYRESWGANVWFSIIRNKKE